jgi:MraZ protein
MSFAGTADHTLDAKNRLSVSTRHRSSLSGPVMLAQDSTTPCVTIWPKAVYDANTDAALAGLNPIGEKASLIKRFRNGRAHEAELDGNGRVGIPPFLLEHAKLDRDVKVIGAGDHLEVWNRALWPAAEDELTKQMAEITRGLDE